VDADTVQQIVQAEISRGLPFNNWHGITSENLDSFLVQPFSVLVDPVDLETDSRLMWIIAQEYPKPEQGYVVVYDPLTRGWGVAEYQKEDQYMLVIGADSLADALDGM
jgi:hypothetical protein